MNLDKKALAGFIQEIEDSRARQKGETEHQRDVFSRAKGKHFDVKAMRIVLQRRAMEPSKRDEQDYNVDAYELALGAKKLAVEAMEQGASAREAAKAHGLPRAAVTALKPGTENENFEPTVIKEAASSGEDAGHRSEPSVPAEQSVYSAPPPERVSLSINGGEETQPGTHSESRSPANWTSAACSAVVPAGNEGTAGERDLAAEAERLGLTHVVKILEARHDAGPMPAFLRRVTA